MKFARKSHANPLSYLKSLPWFPKGISWLLTVLCLQLFTGCYYYTVEGIDLTGQEAYAAKIREFNEAEKYIVLHQNASTLHLQNAILDESNMALRGVPVLLSEEHVYKHQAEVGRTYRYKNKKQYPLNEVHLYIENDVNLILNEWGSIPLTEIQKVAFTKQDKAKSAVNGVMGFIGILALIMIIVALTKSSCPFLYVDNGNGPVFQGELYPGSIMENAQTPDYLRLPLLKETGGYYNLEITNELLEIQHTDQAVLQVVDHPADTEVYMSPGGELFTIRNAIPPIHALADDLHDVTQTVRVPDQISWSFETPQVESDGKRHLDLKFDPLEIEGDVKLLLTLRNTLWLDYVMGSFYKQFGTYYSDFQRDQQDVTYDEAFRWRSDQSLPLNIYLKTAEGWVLQDQVPAVGPMAYRDIVIPLRPEQRSEAPIELRLETGFMFWEVDRIALESSREIPLHVQTVYPELALDQNDRDVADLLKYRDGKYLTQGEVGNSAQLKYKSPPIQNKGRTVFLKNTGYYTYIRDYDGVPDFSELKKFREPGHFTEFAEAEFHKIVEGLISNHPNIATNHED